MKIIFGYYEDEDFGLTPYPDIFHPDKGKFDSFEEYAKEEEKIGEYTKFLITGIMEDFQYVEMLDDFLVEIKKVDTEKQKETEWDGQAFQHKINKKKVELTHTIFGECEEYPKWSCKFDDYKKVLYGWAKFLKMPESLKTKLEIEI